MLMRDSLSALIHEPRSSTNLTNSIAGSKKTPRKVREYGSMEPTQMEVVDVFELGELPLHLAKEYKHTYMSQISMEKYLILKVKETEKENRLLRNQLAHAKGELKVNRDMNNS